MVTKVRYIIEKQIGYLKEHKALDNIRNTIGLFFLNILYYIILE